VFFYLLDYHIVVCNLGDYVLKRIWGWILGNQSINLNVSVEIKDLDKITRVLSQFDNNRGIINSSGQLPRSSVSMVMPTEKKSQPKQKKKLKDDPIQASDVAELFSAEGIPKAIDKTGSNVISQSEGKSTDDKLSSLKRLSKRKGN